MISRLAKTVLTMIAVSAIIMASTPVFASSKAYSIQSWDIYARLQPDGSAFITETIEYDMHENLRDFRYEIDHSMAGSISLDKIGVADNSPNFDQEIFVEAEPIEDLSAPARPLSFHFSDDGAITSINLHVFSEAQSIRTVSISYKLDSLVTRYENMAVVEYEFFDSDTGKNVNSARLTMQIPEPAAIDEIWTMPAGLAEFTIFQPNANQLSMTSDFIAAEDEIFLTMIMPGQLFPESAQAEEIISREELIENARNRDEIIHRRHQTRENLLNLIYVLLFLALIIVLIIYGRFDRESNRHMREIQDAELLYTVPPAILAVFMKKKRAENLILSTLFDLVRRGELDRDGLVFFRTNRNSEYIGCKAFEIFLLQWLFGHLADGDAVSITEVRRYAHDSATAEEFQIYYRQFCNLIQEAYDESGYVDQRKTSKGRMINGIAGTIYLALGLEFVFVLQIMTGALLFLPAAWFFIYSFVLRRQSDKGEEYYASVQIFLEQIKRPEKIDPDSLPEVILKFLPQAIALDRAIPFLKSLIWAFPDGLPVADTDLGVYGLTTRSGSWKSSAGALSEDIKVMDSLLSASILLASGIHS